MNPRTVTRGDAALAAAALLLLISSFLPYYSADCGSTSCTANAWHGSFFPLLPAVFFLGVIGAALLLAGAAIVTPLIPQLTAPLLPNAPAGAPPVGPGGYPAYGQQGQPGQYPYPQQQFQQGEPVQQAQPGQPFSGPQDPAAPQQGGAYGYPQQTGPQAPSYGGQFGAQAPAPAPTPTPVPAPAPQDVPPPRYQDQPEPQDHATAMLIPAVKRQSEPVQPEPEAQPDLTKAEPEAAAAPAFAPFWFAVPAARSLAPEEDAEGASVGELVPGTWYLAIAQHGDALLTQTQEGRRGLLADTTGIQRG
ncbi:MAG TPA: hypothetical protein VK599_11110 [Streptosporangiaceae bacterium]|nr:hypothetical protein [Streptosporangiaceae bacterium]